MMMTPEYLATLTTEAKRLWAEQRPMRIAGVEIDDTLPMVDWYAAERIDDLDPDPVAHAKGMVESLLRAARFGCPPVDTNNYRRIMDGLDPPPHKAYREGPDVEIELVNDGTAVAARAQMGFA